MRYLHKRNEFLIQKNILQSNKNFDINKEIKTSALVNETFENDISWGGSMIGRLINSTLRVAKIYYKTARIGSLIPQVEKALDDLVLISRTSEDQRKEISQLTGRFLLEEIIKVVNSKDSVQKKVAQLLGNENETNPGLVQTTIDYIEGLDDFPDKATIIEKLKAFKEALKTLKSEVGDPEDEDGDEESDSSDSSDGKSAISRLQSNFFNLLQSIRMIGDLLKLKKVSIEGDEKKPIKVEAGKEYTYTDKSGKKVQVKVIDAQFQRQPGGDNQFLTTDDVIDKTKKITPKVLIAQKNNKGVYGKGSITTIVDPKVLSESLVFEEFVGTGRGRGEGADSEIKKGESDSKSAFAKVRSAFIKNDIYSTIPKMEEMKKKRMSGDKEMGTYMVQIMKQVMQNEETIGKPLTFQELIKEAINVQQTEYAPIIKSISVLARVLLAFKDDMGLLQSMGELKKPITQFIESYDNAKKVLPEIKEEKNESFRIFEAEEGQSQSEGEDKVKKSWRNEFSEEEEKKYNVDPTEAKKLQKSINEEEKVNIDVKNPEQYDRILRIVELFGKAYKMYAVDVIPSGRPNGRISQKTFRDYEYIGKDASSTPTWQEGQTPGFGPWAARITYEKWQDGIMGILQDTKYRSVLANSEFVNAGPNQEKGSGLTLFSFMNDMLNEGGAYSNFRQRRHALLTKYFGGNSDKVEKEAGDGDGGIGNIKPEDAGTPNESSFFLLNLLKSGNYIEISNVKNDKNNYRRTILLVKGKSGGVNEQFIIYIVAYTEGISKRKLVIIKAHRQPVGEIKQSLVSKYLSNRFKTNETLENEEDRKTKLTLSKDIKFVENQPIYYGVVEFDGTRIFEEGKKTNIKLIKSSDITSGNKSEDIELTVTKCYLLGYHQDKPKNENKVIKVEDISEYPSLDKQKELLNLFKSNSRVQSNFGIDKEKEKK
jgi:hypothetical protein